MYCIIGNQLPMIWTIKSLFLTQVSFRNCCSVDLWEVLLRAMAQSFLSLSFSLLSSTSVTPDHYHSQASCVWEEMTLCLLVTHDLLHYRLFQKERQLMSPGLSGESEICNSSLGAIIREELTDTSPEYKYELMERPGLDSAFPPPPGWRDLIRTSHLPAHWLQVKCFFTWTWKSSLYLAF